MATEKPISRDSKDRAIPWEELYAEWPKFGVLFDYTKSKGVGPEVVKPKLDKIQRSILERGGTLTDVTNMKGTLDPLEEFVSNTTLTAINNVRKAAIKRPGLLRLSPEAMEELRQIGQNIPLSRKRGELPAALLEAQEDERSTTEITVGAFGSVLEQTLGRIVFPFTNARNLLIRMALDPNEEFSISEIARAAGRGITLEEKQTGTDALEFLSQGTSAEEFFKEHPWLKFGGGIAIDLFTPPFGLGPLGSAGRLLSKGTGAVAAGVGKGLGVASKAARGRLSYTASDKLDNLLLNFNTLFRANQNPLATFITKNFTNRERAIKVFGDGVGIRLRDGFQKISKELKISGPNLSDIMSSMWAIQVKMANVRSKKGINEFRSALDELGDPVVAAGVRKITDDGLRDILRFTNDANRRIIKYRKDLAAEIGEIGLLPQFGRKGFITVTKAQDRLTELASDLNKNIKELAEVGITNPDRAIELVREGMKIGASLEKAEGVAAAYPFGPNVGRVQYLEQLQKKIVDSGLTNKMLEHDYLASQLGFHAKYANTIIKPEALLAFQRSRFIGEVIEGEPLAANVIANFLKYWVKKVNPNLADDAGGLKPSNLTPLEPQEINNLAKGIPVPGAVDMTLYGKNKGTSTLPGLDGRIFPDGVIETNPILILVAQVSKGERLKAKVGYILDSLKQFNSTDDFISKNKALDDLLDEAKAIDDVAEIKRLEIAKKRLNVEFPEVKIGGVARDLKGAPVLAKEFGKSKEEIDGLKSLLKEMKGTRDKAVKANERVAPDVLKTIDEIELKITESEIKGNMTVRVPKDVKAYLEKIDQTFMSDIQFTRFWQWYDTIIRSWVNITLPIFPGYFMRNFSTNLMYLYFNDVSIIDLITASRVMGFERVIKRMERLAPVSAAESAKVAKGRKVIGDDGRIHTFEDIKKMGEEGVWDTGFIASVNQTTLRDRLGLGSPLPGKVNEFASKLASSWPVQKGFDVNTGLENLTRTALLIKALRRGTSEEMVKNFGLRRAAIMEVRKNFPDRSNLTPFEKVWAKRVFPFYGWQRFNIPRMMELIVNKPDKFTRIQMAQQNAREALFSESSIPGPGKGRPFDPEGAPRFFQINGPFQWESREGKINVLTTVGWFPWGDLEPFISMDRVKSMGALANMATPVIVPIEVLGRLDLGARRRLGKDDPTLRFAGMEIDPATAHFLSLFRIITTANAALGLGEFGDPVFRSGTKDLSDVDYYELLRRAARIFPGLSVSTIDKTEFAGALKGRFLKETSKFKGAMLRALEDGDRERADRLGQEIRMKAKRVGELLSGGPLRPQDRRVDNAKR